MATPKQPYEYSVSDTEALYFCPRSKPFLVSRRKTATFFILESIYY